MKSADINENLTDLHIVGEDIKQYADVRLQIIRLNVTEKVAFALSNLITTAIAWAFAFLTILCLGIGFANWLGEKLENNLLGFLIIAAFFLCFVFITRLLAKGNIKPKIAARLIHDFSKDENDEIEK